MKVVFLYCVRVSLASGRYIPMRHWLSILETGHYERLRVRASNVSLSHRIETLDLTMLVRFP